MPPPVVVVPVATLVPYTDSVFIVQIVRVMMEVMPHVPILAPPGAPAA